LAVLSGRCLSGVTGRMAGRVLATHPSLYVGVMRTPAGMGLYTGARKASVVEVDGRKFIVAAPGRAGPCLTRFTCMDGTKRDEMK
jgi:hypothetical protein